MLYLKRRGMINVLGARRDKYTWNNPRNFLDHRPGHGGAVRPRFTMRERERERVEKERKKKEQEVGSIVSFVDNRTVTERQVLE